MRLTRLALCAVAVTFLSPATTAEGPYGVAAIRNASSNFPRFDVNPNTGEPLNDNRRWRVAQNSVFHDSRRPSHIVLPIIPVGGRTTTGGQR
jgi:hypothetical protein